MEKSVWFRMLGLSSFRDHGSGFAQNGTEEYIKEVILTLQQCPAPRLRRHVESSLPASSVSEQEIFTAHMTVHDHQENK